MSAEDFLFGSSSKESVPNYASRASFDANPELLSAFDQSKKSAYSSKLGNLNEDEEEVDEKTGRRKGSLVDVMDLAGVDDQSAKKKKTKKKKKAVKIVDEKKKNDDEDDEEVNVVPRSRGITTALVELTKKTSVVQDLHIVDAWGTVAPKVRKVSADEDDIVKGGGRIPINPRMTVVVEDDAHGYSRDTIALQPGAQFKGLLVHDDVEERVERIQLNSRRSSAPNVPKFLEKRSDKDEFQEVLEELEKKEKIGKRLPENIKRLLVEAHMGWTESQFTLGYCYDTGSGGVQPDSTEAIHWYQAAAESGHVTAQNNLGVLLATGHRKRMKPNPAEAFKWYEKAAHNGHPNAEFHLGLANLKGDGLEKKNEIQAFHWFERAARQGHVLGQANIGAMYMSGQGVKQDFEKARKWSKKAANQGSAIAHHNLAVIYRKGYGIDSDEELFRHHLNEAMLGANSGILSKKLSEDTLKAGNTLMNM